jgi:hypothetical protein
VREDDTEALWREGAASMAEKSGLKFKTETVDRVASYTDLDRTKVEATADNLLEMPTGLAIFLRHARNRQPHHPMSTIGPAPGPAIVSYGRACAMFGEPTRPKDDWPTEDPVSGSVQVDIGQLSPPDELTLAQPSTEREYRQLDASRPPTVSILSEKEQWALFTKDRWLAYTEVLAREYVRLVKEKERLEEAKTAEQSGTDKEESSEPITGPTGLPLVEGLDFAGFTNWIHRCEQVDETFRLKTVPSWDHDKVRRYDLRTTLSSWNLEAALANGYDDGSARYSSQPGTHYPLARSICNIDSKKAGFELARDRLRQ